MSAGSTPGLGAATRLAVARIAVERGSRARLAIRGHSMLPMLREPMTIDVAALRRTARVGDVLVFRAGDAYIAHRVVGSAGGVCFTSGDGQPDVVERVEPADVLGRVEAVWSDGSPAAVRVDTALHRLRGLLYAHLRTARLGARRIAGRVRRLRAREI